MSLSDTYTALGNAIRRQYGTTDKYSLVDMPKMIDSLHVNNLLNEGQFYDTTKGDSGDKGLKGLYLSDWQKLSGKRLTISFDITWSGYKPVQDSNNRTGIEYGIKFKNSPTLWFSVWVFPKSLSGNEHVCASYTLPNDEVTDVVEGFYFNQINNDAVVKAINFKVVVNPMGGVIPVNLFDNHLKYEPQFAKQEGTLYTFDITTINPPYDSFIFTNGVVLVEPNQAYKLKFKARGTGSFWTYEYGNNYQGTYVDNGHEWNLTDQWQDYEQLFPIESVPIKHDDNGLKDGFLVDIRTMKPLYGEIADIEFIPIN